jgi:subtilisin family serine protease
MPQQKKASLAVAASVAALLLLGSGAIIQRKDLRKRPDSSGFSSPPRVLRQTGPRRFSRFRYAKDRIIVKFKAGLSREYVEGLIGAYRFQTASKITQIGTYVLRIPPSVTVAQAVSALRRNPDVARVGPDYRIRLAVTPNDSYFRNYQYALSNRGGVLNINPETQPQMTAGADIKAPTAWDETQGDESVVIAVLDTGVDREHPELDGKLVSPERDFVNDDFDADDDHWHGTHVAGIAAAETNNGEGIAGVSWNSKILPVKVIDSTGEGYYSWLIDGIVWATDNGAKVINLSLGGDVDDTALRDACRYAYEQGVLIVAAAGNEASTVLYPAAYDAYVLAIAATDYNDEWADFSNTGPQVDAAAPGVYILSAVPQESVGDGYVPYLFATGTSQAAPHAAGLGALIMGLKPWLPVKDVMSIIRYTADDVNSGTFRGKDDYLGYGRINMTRALAPTILE